MAKDCIRDIQIAKVDMLRRFSSVCATYGIRWFVDGGTLLGTVRHGAFIPWDDDIDVSVPRADYARLCCIPQEDFSPFFMQWRGSDWQAARGHMQIRRPDTTEILMCEMTKHGKAMFTFNQGLFMDVFPIDFIPDGWENGLGDDLWRLKKGAWDSRANRATCEALQKEFDDLSGKCNKSGIMHTIAVDFNPSRFTPAECFGDLVQMRFEGLDVFVPAGYERRLRHLYGDGWKTPQKEPTVHGKTFVDLKHPYTYYLSS